MTLLEQYEQQYATLIAETTSSIATIHSHSGPERRELCSKIDTNLAEAQELLEQIGLEIRDVNSVQRPAFTSRLNCAQVELKRLQNEYRCAKEIKANNIPKPHLAIDVGATTSDGDYYDDVSISNDQRQRLLDNSERIERTNNRLADSYRVVLETESLGAQVLNDLHHQRETLQGARSRLRQTNADLGRASRSLNQMALRAIREKVVLYFVGFCFVVAVVVSLYLTFAPNSQASA